MKVIFFSPHAFIGAHAIPEALVARALQNLGHEILYIGCNRAFKKYCISMSAGGLSPDSSISDKEKICQECISRKKAISNKFDLNSIDINEYISEGDLIEITELIKRVNGNNWFDFWLYGIPVGKFAAYEFLLNNKINRLNLTKEEFEIYRIALINSLASLFAARKIFSHFKPDKLVVYNSFYSVNHMFCAYASSQGIDYYTIHAGSHLKDRLSLLSIFRGNQAASLNARAPSWDLYKKKFLTKKNIDKVHRHIRELFLGNSPWVYSNKAGGLSNDQVRSFFSVGSNAKVILATLTSHDEGFAGALVGAVAPYDKPIFESEDDWISFLLEFAKNNYELVVIIRVHPREFPNKREQVKGLRATQLEEKFKILPSNVRINYPQDNISIHDLLKIVNVGLNTTSTTGIEFMLHNVPVINCDSTRILAYPNDLHIVAKDKIDYERKILEAINYGSFNSNVLLIYKWLSFLFEIVQINIEDVYSVEKASLPLRIIRYISRKIKYQNLLQGLKSNSIDSVKNMRWLTYAIENNCESHLEERIKMYQNSSDALPDEAAEVYIKLLLNKALNRVALRS